MKKNSITSINGKTTTKSECSLKTFVVKARGVQVNLEDMHNLKALVSKRPKIQVNAEDILQLKTFISQTSNIKVKLVDSCKLGTSNIYTSGLKVDLTSSSKLKSLNIECIDLNSQNQIFIKRYRLEGTGPRKPYNSKNLYGAGPFSPKKKK